MSRIVVFRGIHLLTAICLTAIAAVAQDDTTATTAPASTPNPIVTSPGAEKPATAMPTTTNHHSRVISADVAAQLAAAVPKYTPPPPKPPPTPEEDQPDMRDIDKPKNGIIRLPKFVVTQPRPAVLSERAINTKKGLADLAMSRYFTETARALNSFGIPLFGSPENLAMTMYEEDERLKNMAALNEDARMISATDKEQGRYVKRMVDETYARPGDFDWKPIGK